MQRKRGGNNWIGIVIFLIIMFGSSLSSFLAGLIQQATGVSVNPSLLLVGLIILAVAVSSLSSLLRGVGQINSGSETTLPTAQSAPPPMPSERLPQIRQPQLPGSPRFDPIIDPRILIFGIIGLVFFGIVFLIILAMVGVI